VIRGRLIGSTLLALGICAVAVHLDALQDSVATFRSSVDLVRVSAIVRDRGGRFVDDLQARDFEILDSGHPRPVTEFRREPVGVSVALLFDVSGSMEAQIANARETAAHVVGWLDPARDEAAVFTFDTELHGVLPFTSELGNLVAATTKIVPFGETSLHDAIAQTARQAGAREGRRRAIVALTDTVDNASRLTPAEVTQIASAIDVPVYIIALLRGIDVPVPDDSYGVRARPATGATSATSPPSAKSPTLATGALTALATETGGHLYVATSAAERALAARQIVDGLRHEYLIAFESSGNPGWHPLVVRARNKDLVVRARRGYIAGQSRPNSN
jgi:VWFA-related protein